MRYWLVVIKALPANAMALFPFILLKRTGDRHDMVLINHEKIHLKQQLELLIIPFYVLYLLNYLVNLLRYKNHDKAYFNIAFEREAYQFDEDLGYLAKRSSYAWRHFLA